MRHLYRTRIDDEILAEFLPPSTPQKRTEERTRVLILAQGIPSIPYKDDVIQYWSEQGYFVVFPRYRGTWESRGSFLKESPTKDVTDTVNAVFHPLRDIYSGEEFTIVPDAVYVLGSSFGGPAALFSSSDPRVTKVIGLSSVIDWRIPTPAESNDALKQFITEGFGPTYRFDDTDWAKLEEDTHFYNPITMQDRIDPEKVLLIHAEDDPFCPAQALKTFAKETGVTTELYAQGGHLGISDTCTLEIRTRIKAWFQ
ncbi:MAG: prolyl oligopeptidase family serine peptidase [Candidatus Paceibacterota bacterium]